MAQLADLELPCLPIDQQAFADGPDPYMLAARAEQGWLARSGLGVVVTDCDACAAILMQDARLKTPGEHIVAIMGGQGTNWARFQLECLIARDGQDHARIRTAINRAFFPRGQKLPRTDRRSGE